MTRNSYGPLRAALNGTGRDMDWLTVLASQNDPFRVDTPAGHRDGAWLRTMWDRHHLTAPKHLRGLHYILIGQTKPNGKPYTNTDADWTWLGGSALKAARWLGYIPFEWIKDERSDDPVRQVWLPSDPNPRIDTNFAVAVPTLGDITPTAALDDFHGEQPYHIVMVNEKSSLFDVLAPLADQYQADLYCMTGEVSDTRIYQIASDGARDGRRMVVLYFSDCDPAGWQMPISVARKLQAFAVLFGELDFRVDRVALTPDQVRQYGLPSTPLKPGEKRADDWTDAMGVRQTEIDALAALQPDLLRQITVDAISEYYDDTLDDRVAEAAEEWQEQAQEILDTRLESGNNDLQDAADRIAAKAAEIRTILDGLPIDTDELVSDLPTPELPDAQTDGEYDSALCDSDWSFVEQCRVLIAAKSYEEYEGPDACYTKEEQDRRRRELKRIRQRQMRARRMARGSDSRP